MLGSRVDVVRRPGVAVIAVIAVLAIVAGCGTGAPSPDSRGAHRAVRRGGDAGPPGSVAAARPPVAAVAATPGFGTTGMAPARPVTVTRRGRA